jgi:hypothetical protein
LASIVANITLGNYGYQIMAVALGGLGTVGMVFWVALVKDPCKNKQI